MLAEYGFSASVFAPGWTYEHFSTRNTGTEEFSAAEAVDRAVWAGATLPVQLDCDCTNENSHHSAYYRQNPIIDYAVEYPMGSDVWFYSDFSGPFDRGPDGVSLFRPKLSGLI
jgi:hypothetical protein